MRPDPLSPLDHALAGKGHRAIDLDALRRQAPPEQGDVDVKIVPRFTVQGYLNVNELFPGFGIHRPDGKPLPVLLVTSLDDKVMRAYLMDVPQVDLLANFFAACAIQQSGVEPSDEAPEAPEPESEPASE